MLDAGQDVGPYRIEAVLGEGGMGVVYRARDTRLNRPGAVKFLSSDVATPAERRRFQREAQTASSLNHPHIVTVLDAGELDGRQFLVTELVDGGTLSEWAHSGQRTWRDVLELLTGVADALATAHEAGILHRDIKPDNVLLTKSGYAKLADFGLARMQVEPHAVTRTVLTDATREGAIVGTVAYMSPEQATGRPLDSRSDIFSFGIVLYELLSGRRPFSGGSSVDLMHAIVHSQPEGLPQALPAALRLAVEKALEKDPADRYQSMRELLVDLRRTTRHSGETETQAVAAVAARGPRWRRWSAAVLVVGGLAGAGAWWVRREVPPPAVLRQNYVQLTSFADSAVAPAISPDGRMLAFIRGEYPFYGPGDVYVKLLPDGEPSALTHDGGIKEGPLVFSPDGSRIAYGEAGNATSTVPVLGGARTRLLGNASGLSWVPPWPPGPAHVMFSALTGEGIHMGVFTSTESRGDQRRVYLPADVNGMAHRSFLSPDGRSVLIVEMDMLGWRPCRVAPFDGSAPGRPVGPERSQCTDAAWSPDGRWMYLSANTGNGYHIWRQAFPDGSPEQVTYTATEEQGLAFAPDGRSFVTSIGERLSTLWVHDGETRQVTSEGYAYEPSFSADGSRLYYLQRSKADRRFVSGELWTSDLRSGARQRLLPDRQIESYDVSADGTRVAFIDVDGTGRSSVWEAVLDGSAPPRRLSAFEALRVMYGPAGDVFFVGGATTSLHLYRLAPDGSSPRQIIDAPANYLYDVSPDDRWVAAWVGMDVAFYPVDGGAPRLVCKYCGTAGEEQRGVTPPLIRWSHDGRFMFLYAVSTRHTYVVKLPRGQLIPALPSEPVAGFAVLVQVLGGQPLEDERAFAGQTPAVYAFPRVTAHRNIYRIPVS
jgi:Tol biopolymer transport system component/predicted Ser/Thr protein kinase